MGLRLIDSPNGTLELRTPVREGEVDAVQAAKSVTGPNVGMGGTHCRQPWEGTFDCRRVVAEMDAIDAAAAGNIRCRPGCGGRSEDSVQGAKFAQ